MTRNFGCDFGLGFGFGQKFTGAFRRRSIKASEIKSPCSVGNFAVCANRIAAACVRRPQIPPATPALHPAALSNFWISVTTRRSSSSSENQASLSLKVFVFFRLSPQGTRKNFL